MIGRSVSLTFQDGMTGKEEARHTIQQQTASDLVIFRIILSASLWRWTGFDRRIIFHFHLHFSEGGEVRDPKELLCFSTHGEIFVEEGWEKYNALSGRGGVRETKGYHIYGCWTSFLKNSKDFPCEGGENNNPPHCDGFETKRNHTKRETGNKSILLVSFSSFQIETQSGLILKFEVRFRWLPPHSF